MGYPTSNHDPLGDDNAGETRLSAHAPGAADFSTQTAPPREPSPLIGLSIGPYLIRSVLGEGGFGVVYLAEQSVPVRRRVALKVIKPGMDTKAVIARFEAERQALAMMNHPGVAKVFDAGQTDAGRPYFAMEYVQGVGLNEHCERHKLPLHDRLELFMRVCDAVQHAHQKGIIHRDLKPSNVLIQYEAGQPAPKVIDFGVAKALDQRLTERTIFTEQGQLVGTPEYMSPEQAEMSVQDIDTRTDIYALGVILYQLITGSLPFDPQSLRSEGFAGIQRIIREVEPVKPSTRLAQLAQSDVKTAEEQASRLQSDSAALRRQLRGDLDWIAMKALEKDRARRYDTAREFAQDIERFLQHEPVLAGPPTAGYRLRKFARRNRAGLAVASIVLVALVSATAISLRMAWIATEAQGVATKELGEANIAREKEKNERLRADGETARAEAQARRATQVAAFLQDVLAAAAKAAREGESREAIKTIVDGAAEKLAAATDMDPIVKARVSLDIGRLYLQIDMRQVGSRHLRQAYFILRKETPGSAEATEAAIELARQMVGAMDWFTDATYGRIATDDLIKEALHHRASVFGVESLEYARVALLAYERALFSTVAPVPSLSLSNAISILEARLGPANEETLEARLLAVRTIRSGQAGRDAVALVEQLENDCVAALGERHTLTLRVRLYRAETAVIFSDAMSADDFRTLIQKLDGADAAAPVAVASLLSRRGTALDDSGRAAAAIPFLERSMELYEHTHGPIHPLTLVVAERLAQNLVQVGRHREAITLLRSVIDRNKKFYTSAHTKNAPNYRTLAQAQFALGEKGAAFDSCRRSLQASLLGNPDDRQAAFFSYSLFGHQCLDIGEVFEARLAAAQASVHNSPAYRSTYYESLEARLAAADGQWTAAIGYANRYVNMLGPSFVADGLQFLAEIQVKAGKLDDAEKTHLRLLGLIRQQRGDQSAAARDAARPLVHIYRAMGRVSVANQLSAQLDAGKVPPNDRIGVDLDRILADARAASDQKDWARALALLERASPVAADLPAENWHREQHVRLHVTVLRHLGRGPEAHDLLSQFFERRREAGGIAGDPALTAMQMHVAFAAADGAAAALDLISQYRKRFALELGPQSNEMLWFLIRCQKALHEGGHWQQAMPLLTEAKEILASINNPAPAARYELLVATGRVALRLKQLDVAEAALLQCLREFPGTGIPGTRFPHQWIHFDLVGVYAARADREKQLAHLRKAYELFASSSNHIDRRWADNTRNDLIALLKSMDRHDDARRVTLGQPWSLTTGETVVSKLPVKMTIEHRLSAATELLKAGKPALALDELAKAPRDLGDEKVAVDQLRMIRGVIESLRAATELQPPVISRDTFAQRIVALMTSFDLAGYEPPVDAEVERAEIAMTLTLLGAHEQAEAIVARAIRVITEQAGGNDRRLVVPHHRMAQTFAYRGLGKKAEPHADKAIAILKATEPKWDAPLPRRWFWSDMALVYEQTLRGADAASALGLLCDDDQHWNPFGPPRATVTLRYVRVGNQLIKAALDAGKPDEARIWVAKLKPQLPVIDAQSAEAKTYQELAAKVGPVGP